MMKKNKKEREREGGGRGATKRKNALAENATDRRAYIETNGRAERWVDRGPNEK